MSEGEEIRMKQVTSDAERTRRLAATKRIGKHLYAEKQSPPWSDRAKYEIRSARGGPLSGDALGELVWYGPWRRYVFRPAPSSEWSSECLSDLVAFMDELKLEDLRCRSR